MDLQLLPLESVEIINHLVPNETEVCLCLLYWTDGSCSQQKDINPETESIGTRTSFKIA